ncbi:hypothetical protein P12x_000891 [Tundrisphaera lichenicola]|uniref:hypothetical protein n=1 Tax=Tundrisphaera lichenicola TaxID=2029860 RepID=UPI003EB837D5
MHWRWTARRLAISAFLVVHLSALAIINLPASALRQACFDRAATYLFPLGLDQAWGMFAPNPVMHSMTLEAMTVDRNGIQRTYAFPKMTDFSIWRAIPRVRHSKFTSNCGVASNVLARELAVRHAIRQLAIPADAFPVEAELFYQVIETPAPGEPPRDPMKPPVPQTLQTYRFPTLAEVQP